MVMVSLTFSVSNFVKNIHSNMEFNLQTKMSLFLFELVDANFFYSENFLPNTYDDKTTLLYWIKSSTLPNDLQSWNYPKIEKVTYLTQIGEQMSDSEIS